MYCYKIKEQYDNYYWNRIRIIVCPCLVDNRPSGNLIETLLRQCPFTSQKRKPKTLNYFLLQNRIYISVF